MRKRIAAIGLIMAFLALAAFRKTDTQLFQIPKGWPEPVYDFRKEPLDQKKIALGRMLFYDPLLSSDSTISCASCHSPYTAFTHIDHDLSHGIEGKIGTRNSPALMNLAWENSFMWDGSIKRLDEQAQAPISNPLEMGESMDHVVHKLQASALYPGLFKEAFGDSAITDKKLLQSISQFMLTLVSANAKYDSVKRGQATFTASEANGYTVFKQHCASCHREPLFTNRQFENNGLFVDETLNDIGRMKVTHNAHDSLKFKVPTLRNIEFSRPYMHDGRFKDLNQVINNYMRGIQHSPTLSPKLQKGIYLETADKIDLVAFLKTLSDKDFLHDQRFSFPQK